MVIGILGILAAGLLATIDPLEQFRKGADSNRKNASLELMNGITRYYATKGVMPWVAAPAGDGCNSAGNPSATKASAAGFGSGTNNCLTALVNQGELKDVFPNQTAILDKLYVTGTATTVTVCYDPESKSESLRAGETLYNQDGTTLAGCPAAAVACYWCAR